MVNLPLINNLHIYYKRVSYFFGRSNFQYSEDGICICKGELYMSFLSKKKMYYMQLRYTK